MQHFIINGNNPDFMNKKTPWHTTPYQAEDRQLLYPQSTLATGKVAENKHKHPKLH